MEIHKNLEEFGIDWEKGVCKRPWDYSHYMLSLVSRTFALNIQVLPTPLKRPILLAYLFCRMADTLEDDRNLSKDRKIELLAAFRLVFVERENCLATNNKISRDSASAKDSPRHLREPARNGK